MTRKSRRSAHKRPQGHTQARRAQEKFAARSFAAAARHCREALESRPDAAPLWHLLAAALLAEGQAQQAREAITRARRLDAGNPEYHNTEALILQRLGLIEAAEDSLRCLLERHPEHSDGAYNLGRLLAANARPQAAIGYFRRAVKARPEWSEAYQNLAHACHAVGEHDAAESAFLAALRLTPNDSETLFNLARLYQHDDRFESAKALFEAGLKRRPDHANLLRLALMSPIFCADAAAIETHRQRVAQDLATLAKQDLVLHDPVSALAAPTFYLPYHGHNDRVLVSRFGDIVARAWQPAAPAHLRRQRRKPRIAMVSAHFKQHAIGRLYAALIERLAGSEDFELAILSVGRHEDPLARRIQAGADLAVAVSAEHDSARLALHELDADLIFYPDVGMDAITYWLAAERIAPLQALGWGHPVTSGLASLDHFVSSSLLEPADAQAHYRETLIELPSWPTIYEDPGAPQTTAFDRAQFGFGHDDHLYVCPQSLFKLHPDFDAYLGAILTRDPAARVILLGSNEHWRARLGARFAAALGVLAERIYFLPAQSVEAFYALLADADVVLDTIHFAGGVTSFETIWAHTPFVSERGAFLRSRVTAGLCDLLDLSHTLTTGATAYAERAVELAHQGPARQTFIATLAERKTELLALGDGVEAAYRDYFNSALGNSLAARDAARKLAS